MYGDKISIEQGGKKRGKIVFNSKMRLEDALRKENDIKRRFNYATQVWLSGRVCESKVHKNYWKILK